MLGLSFLSIVLAFLSWKYIEQPFRNSQGGIYRKHVFLFAGVSTCVVLTAGLYGHFGKGMPERLAPSGYKFSELKIDEIKKPNHGLSSDCEGDFNLSDNCRTSENPSVMLWGDSYAMHLAQALVESKSYEGSLIQFTKSACPPVIGISRINRSYTTSWANNCIKFKKDVLSYILANNNIEYVIMSSSMSIVSDDLYDSSGFLHDYPQDFLLDFFEKTFSTLRNAGKK